METQAFDLNQLQQIGYGIFVLIALFFGWPVLKQARANSMIDLHELREELRSEIKMLRSRTHKLNTRQTTVEVTLGIQRNPDSEFD